MKTLVIISLILSMTSIQNNFAQDAIHTKTHGEGKPVLLLPGFANSSEVWKDTIENIEGTYEIHLIDYAGFNAHAPIEFPWLPKVKLALKNYISKNALKEVTIIGHSLGGTLALYLAAELPEHIEQIIVVDALPHTAGLMFPDQKSGSFSYENPYAESQLTMPDEAFQQMLNGQIQMMCEATEKHEQILEWITKTDRETYVKGYIDYLNFDATPLLKNINAEVIILAATSYGKAQSEQVYRTQYANLANYQINYAENAAHYIMYDQPEWFYEQINQALTHEQD